MKCTKCGYELSNEAKFCPNCGQKVFKKLFCRECGETLPEGAKFCEKCGAPVNLQDEDFQEKSLIKEDIKENVEPNVEEPTKISKDTILSYNNDEEKLEENKKIEDTSETVVEVETMTNTEKDSHTEQRAINEESDIVKSPEQIINEPVKNKTSIKEKSKFSKMFDKGRDWFIDLWKRSDNFVRVLIIISILLFLSFLISLFSGKILNILLSIILFVFTVVLFLIHKGEISLENSTLKKYMVIALVLLTLLNSCTAISSNKNKSSDNKKPSNITTAPTVPAKTTANTPLSSEECIGKNNEEVYSAFKNAGFKNIYNEEINDLELAEIEQVGKVDSVLVAESAKFEKNKEFSVSAQVTIKSHGLKKVASPVSSESAKTMNTDELVLAFENVGWEVTVADDVFDIDPDETENEFENFVLINSESTFDETSEFPINSTVKITTHRPFEKYSLKISIDFLSNLMFSKYDVKFIFNDETKLLEHGQDAEFEYSLKPGSYKVEFVSEESSSVTGNAMIDLTGNTEVEYKIHCTSEKINVERTALVNDGAIGDNETIAPASISNCKYENFREVESWFRDAGFTNITTQPQYDIVWGLTSVESVANVSIGGKDEFIRGDVFAKDSPVIIYYHLKENDDPNKPKEESKDTDSSSSPSSPSTNSSSGDQIETSNESTGMSRSEFIAYLKTVTKLYKTDQLDISVTTIFGDIEVNMKQKGMHDIVILAKSGNKQALSAWNSFVESARQMSDALAQGAYNNGLDEPIYVNILDDEAWLLPESYATCVYGIVQVDTVNGIDLTSN